VALHTFTCQWRGEYLGNLSGIPACAQDLCMPQQLTMCQRQVSLASCSNNMQKYRTGERTQVSKKLEAFRLPVFSCTNNFFPQSNTQNCETSQQYLRSPFVPQSVSVLCVSESVCACSISDSVCACSITTSVRPCIERLERIAGFLFMFTYAFCPSAYTASIPCILCGPGEAYSSTAFKVCPSL
jgi:hypothetical protein